MVEAIVETGSGLEKQYWYYHLGLVIPLVAALSPALLYDRIPMGTASRPIKACLVGVLIAVLSYVGMKYVIPERHPLKQAVLCGLLCAEVMVFSGGAFPSMAGITLWLFFYFHSIHA